MSQEETDSNGLGIKSSEDPTSQPFRLTAGPQSKNQDSKISQQKDIHIPGITLLMNGQFFLLIQNLSLYKQTNMLVKIQGSMQ